MEHDGGLHKKQVSIGTYILPCVVFLIILACFFRGISSVSSVTEEKEMENLSNAVVESAVHCYAVEGVYPESIDYLEEHYGLSYDTKKYIVRYDIVGKNLRPKVAVRKINR